MRPRDADLRDGGSASHLRCCFVVMNNQDPINGLKSIPFSPDADQAVSGMSSNMLPSAAAASSVLYYLEAAVGYNLVDVVRF